MQNCIKFIQLTRTLKTIRLNNTQLQWRAKLVADTVRSLALI